MKNNSNYSNVSNKQINDKVVIERGYAPITPNTKNVDRTKPNIKSVNIPTKENRK